MKRNVFLVMLLLSCSAEVKAKTADEHFQDVVARVQSADGSKLSYMGVYPGITREAALVQAKAGDKVIAAHEDPATKGMFSYHMDSPKRQIQISFPDFGQDVPETRGASEIRSHLVIVKRIAPQNAMFDKDVILSEIKSELGEPDYAENKGVMHSFYYGYYLKGSNKSLYLKCMDEFKVNNPGARPPSTLGNVFSKMITPETIGFVMETCPDTIEFYKDEKVKQLSPWVWIQFNESKRDMNVTMNYLGEEYLSSHKKHGPLYVENP